MSGKYFFLSHPQVIEFSPPCVHSSKSLSYSYFLARDDKVLMISLNCRNDIRLLSNLNKFSWKSHLEYVFKKIMNKQKVMLQWNNMSKILHKKKDSWNLRCHGPLTFSIFLRKILCWWCVYICGQKNTLKIIFQEALWHHFSKIDLSLISTT